MGADKRLSRRELLRRAGIATAGGAAVWATPAISTLSVAHAQVGSTASCPVWDCTQPFQSICNCGGIGGAFVRTFSGECVCARPVESAPDCGSCPPLHECLGPATNCGTHTVVCGRPC